MPSNAAAMCAAIELKPGMTCGAKRDAALHAVTDTKLGMACQAMLLLLNPRGLKLQPVHQCVYVNPARIHI